MLKKIGTAVGVFGLFYLLKSGRTLKFTDVVGQLTRASEFEKRNLSEIKNVVVHHTAGNRHDTPETIAAYHVNSRGFRGIGYHIVIDQKGEVFLCNYLDRISSHVGGKNRGSIGVSCVGNFENYDIENIQYKSLVDVLKWLKKQFKDIKIVPHQLFSSTACPGKFLMARLFPGGKNGAAGIGSCIETIKNGDIVHIGVEAASKHANQKLLELPEQLLEELVHKLFFVEDFDELTPEFISNIANIAINHSNQRIRDIYMKTFRQLQYYYSNMSNLLNYE